jgi:hypothetical protein
MFIYGSSTRPMEVCHTSGSCQKSWCFDQIFRFVEQQSCRFWGEFAKRVNDLYLHTCIPDYLNKMLSNSALKSVAELRF